MVIPKKLTDLADSSWNSSIIIYKGLCAPRTYTDISQDLPLFDCS